MIETINLAPGITLRCVRDLRFKHGCLSIQLIRPMEKQEAAINALLPAVLLRGTTRCPDLRSITWKLDDLYGASVSTLVRRIGDYQTTGLFASFMEDRFALPGDQVLAPMIRFLGELLLDPVRENGVFSTDFVESEKRNLISTIESELNDKRAYAMGRMLRTMCSRDSFGIPRLGEKEQVAAITPASAWEHYQYILKVSPVEIFYVGSFEPARVASLLKRVLPDLPRDFQPLAPQGAWRESEPSDVTEEMDIAQGKLCLGYVTPITNQDPRFAAMQVFNGLFGAGMTSKLFMNVRERMSLCYAIGSGYYGSKGILTVSAGIDFDKEALVRGEIDRQLEACRRGEITREELHAAREGILSSLRGLHDTPGAIESFYGTGVLSGLKMTRDAYMAAVEKVTAEDVQAVAKLLRLHTTYFLKGVAV